MYMHLVCSVCQIGGLLNVLDDVLCTYVRACVHVYACICVCACG